MIGAVASQGAGRELFSFFRRPLPDVLTGDPADAPPIDPDSANIVARLAWEMPRLTTLPGRGYQWGPKLTPRCPVYRVGPGVPRKPVSSARDDASYSRYQLSNEGIPIPPAAVVAQPGDYNDQMMAVWSPAEDTLWDGYGMNHTLNDMTVYPPGCVAQSGGTLAADTAYFYRVTGVIDENVNGVEGETGINTLATSGTPTRVGTVITTSTNKKALVKIWPRYMIDRVRVYRCRASNGSTLPAGPTGSPPDGQAYFYHRLSTTGIVYRWTPATSSWTALSGTFPYAPPDGNASDYGLVAELTPATHPTLFAVDGVLTSFTDTGLTPNQAISPPMLSTAISDDDTWRSWYVGTLRNVSACPGHAQDIASGPGSPQQRGWAASATCIPALAGLIDKRDFERSEIDHVMTFAIHNLSASDNNLNPPKGSWSDDSRFAYPAQNHDNFGMTRMPTAAQLAAGCPAGSMGIPEGARFRLPADFDLDTIYSSAAYKALTTRQAELCRMFAEAIQRYGLVPSDGTVGINIHCTFPVTEDPDDPAIAQYGSPDGPSNPDAEYDGRYGTTWRPGWAGEYAALKPRLGSNGSPTGPGGGGPFPWDALEVVRMGWGPDYRGDPADLSPCTSTAIPCPLGGQ